MLLPASTGISPNESIKILKVFGSHPDPWGPRATGSAGVLSAPLEADLIRRRRKLRKYGLRTMRSECNGDQIKDRMGTS